jgi:hypothetical protein
LEEKLIFAINQNNVLLYNEISKNYIAELVKVGEINKIRQFFNDLFVNKSS